MSLDCEGSAACAAASGADETEDAQDRLSRAFDSLAFRRALGTYVTGVAVVGVRMRAAGESRLFGLTVNSFASVSLDPPLVLWSMKRSNPHIDWVAAASHFTVSVLASHQLDQCHHFARPLPDRFDSVDHRIGMGGAPYLPDSTAIFECAREATFDGGDHLIFLGRVLRLAHHGGDPLVIYGGQRIDLARATPA